MQKDDLKQKTQQIVDDVKTDSDKLVKDYKKEMEQYQQQLIAELSKSNSKKT